MQAPKNGFFYILDRTNGELISAEKFTYVNWADSVDLKTGRPVENKWARYDKANIDLAPDLMEPITGSLWRLTQILI